MLALSLHLYNSRVSRAKKRVRELSAERFWHGKLLEDSNEKIADLKKEGKDGQAKALEKEVKQEVAKVADKAVEPTA